MPICLSVFMPVRSHNSKTARNFVHVACGRGSVLLWHCCDVLSTSGFTDDDVFISWDQWVSRYV